MRKFLNWPEFLIGSDASIEPRLVCPCCVEFCCFVVCGYSAVPSVCCLGRFIILKEASVHTSRSAVPLRVYDVDLNCCCTIVKNKNKRLPEDIAFVFITIHNCNNKYENAVETFKYICLCLD